MAGERGHSMVEGILSMPEAQGPIPSTYTHTKDNNVCEITWYMVSTQCVLF
jgi:hypothetical protein